MKVLSFMPPKYASRFLDAYAERSAPKSDPNPPAAATPQRGSGQSKLSHRDPISNGTDSILTPNNGMTTYGAYWPGDAMSAQRKQEITLWLKGGDDVAGLQRASGSSVPLDRWAPSPFSDEWLAMQPVTPQKVMMLVSGDSPLEELSAAEQHYVADTVIGDWQSQGDMDSIRELAGLLGADGVGGEAYRGPTARYEHEEVLTRHAFVTALTANYVKHNGDGGETWQNTELLRLGLLLHPAATLAACHEAGTVVGSVALQMSLDVQADLLQAVGSTRAGRASASEARLVFEILSGTTPDDFLSERFRESMAQALTAVLSAQGLGGDQKLQRRFESLLSSEGGRDLLGNKLVSPEKRIWAAVAFANTPEWNPAVLKDGWGSEVVGKKLFESIASSPAISESTEFPDLQESVVDGLDAHQRLSGVLATVRRLGGSEVTLVSTPVVITSKAVGAEVYTLYGFTGSDGEILFIDDANPQHTFDSLDAWRANNSLPPGFMTYVNPFASGPESAAANALVTEANPVSLALTPTYGMGLGDAYTPGFYVSSERQNEIALWLKGELKRAECDQESSNPSLGDWEEGCGGIPLFQGRGTWPITLHDNSAISHEEPVTPYGVVSAFSGKSALGALTESEKWLIAESVILEWRKAGRTDYIHGLIESPSSRYATSENDAAWALSELPESEKAALRQSFAAAIAGASTESLVTTVGDAPAHHDPELLETALLLDPVTAVNAYAGSGNFVGEVAAEMNAEVKSALLHAVDTGVIDPYSEVAIEVVLQIFQNSHRGNFKDLGVHSDPSGPDDFRGELYRESMAGALAQVVAGQSAATGSGLSNIETEELKNRFDALLSSEGGRNLLVNEDVRADQRVWAAFEVARNPTWDAAMLKNGWETEVVSSAYSQFVHGGEQGLYRHDLPFAELETHTWDSSQPNPRLELVLERIRELGGSEASVTVMPVVVTGNGFGGDVFSVYQFEDAEGVTHIIEDVDPKLRYKDLADWEAHSRLPPGVMTYAPGSRQDSTEVCYPITTKATPMVRDTFGEWAKTVGESVVLGVGITAGVMATVGSGGAAAPAVLVMYGGVVAYGAGVAVESQAHLYTHGVNIADMTDPEVAGNIIAIAGAGTGVGSVLARGAKGAGISIMGSATAVRGWTGASTATDMATIGHHQIVALNEVENWSDEDLVKGLAFYAFVRGMNRANGRAGDLAAAYAEGTSTRSRG